MIIKKYEADQGFLQNRFKSRLAAYDHAGSVRVNFWNLVDFNEDNTQSSRLDI